MKQFFSSDVFRVAVRKKAANYEKEQTQTLSHWSLLIVFTLFIYASLFQQLLLLGVLIGLIAFVRGPLMLLWGGIYSALVAFFPPLALVLSLLFLIINAGAALKNWRVFLTGSFFYAYPPVVRYLSSLEQTHTEGLLLLATAIGIVSLHFILKWLYRQDFYSRTLLWAILSMPHDFFCLFLPKQFRKLKRTKTKL